jgi:hypothetical protein
MDMDRAADRSGKRGSTDVLRERVAAGVENVG